MDQPTHTHPFVSPDHEKIADVIRHTRSSGGEDANWMNAWAEQRERMLTPVDNMYGTLRAWLTSHATGGGEKRRQK